MIEQGAILTYSSTWYANLWTSVNSLVAQIQKDLAGVGLAIRGAPQVNNPTLAVVGGIAGLGGNTFGVTFQVQVENGLGYNSQDDVASIVDGFVYQETGRIAVGTSIPYVQHPDGSTDQTGEPAPTQTTSTSDCIAGTSNDLTGNFSIACWFSNLTSKGFAAVGVLAILAVVGLILLAKAQKVAT